MSGEAIPEGGIVLKSQFPTCKVELPATVTFEGIPADLALPAKKAADDGAIGYPLALPVAASFDEADAAACGYALVAPIAVGGTLTLSVATSEGGTRDVPLTLPAAGFGAGKAYVVVLRFAATQITPQATVLLPWEEAGDRIEVIRLGLSCDRDGPITENVSFSVRRKRSGGGECGGRKPETKKA